MTHPQTIRGKAGANAGFTLVEILLALGVFAIGMIAVASLFPVAALLQKQTVDEVIAGNAALNAKAVVEAKQLSFAPAGERPGQAGDLDDYHSKAGPTKTNALPLREVNQNVAISARLLTRTYSPADRSYPTANVRILSNGVANLDECDLFWIPFIQDISGDDAGTSQVWVLRLFIVERNAAATYPGNNGEPTAANANDPAAVPKVIPASVSVIGTSTFRMPNANHGLRAEDVLMDSNGNDYLITNVDGRDLTVLGNIVTTPLTPSVVWYAPPYGAGRSPGKRVETVKIDVNILSSTP